MNETDWERFEAMRKLLADLQTTCELVASAMESCQQIGGEQSITLYILELRSHGGAVCGLLDSTAC
jgi:hypothetical protein